MNRLALAALTLAFVLQPRIAYAGGGDAFAAFVIGPSLVALFVFPIGLALHWLIMGFSPRRGLALVEKLQTHRAKTIVLGSINTFFLLFFALATAKPAPALALLAVLFWMTLALVGSHGIARSLGVRILGRDQSGNPPDDVKELAIGWFVAVFVVAFPLLGLFVGAYWGVRATGGVILTLLADDEPVAMPPWGGVEAETKEPPPSADEKVTEGASDASASAPPAPDAT